MLKFLVFLIVFLFCGLVVVEIFIPMMKGTKPFPMFRKRRRDIAKAKSDLREVRDIEKELHES